MAATAPFAPAELGTKNGKRRGVQPLRAGQGSSFFWRRLHSLTGIVPIGAFLIEHILSNWEIVNGPVAYAKQVIFLNSLPLVLVLEWTFIFIPLAYHAFYGVYIALQGRASVNVYPWASNWMYVMQRVTGIIGLAYIIQHLYRQRFTGVRLADHPGYAFQKVQTELHNPWMLAFYIIGMIALTSHFAYGVWLFSVKWGITPGDRARRRMGYATAGLGFILCFGGLFSIYKAATYPVPAGDVMPNYQHGEPDAHPTITSSTNSTAITPPALGR